MIRPAVVVIALALAARPTAAVAQYRDSSITRAQIRPEAIPVSLRLRLVAAAAGSVAGIYSARTMMDADAPQRLTVALALAYVGSAFGSAVPVLESECSFGKRLQWSFVGATAGAAFSGIVFAFNQDFAGAIAFAFAVPIGSAAGGERPCRSS